MDQPHELRCYDYVNHPYPVVRDALRADLGGIFERATKSATGRAHALAANLKVDLGALEIGTDIAIEVRGVEVPGRPTRGRGVGSGLGLGDGGHGLFPPEVKNAFLKMEAGSSDPACGRD